MNLVADVHGRPCRNASQPKMVARNHSIVVHDEVDEHRDTRGVGPRAIVAELQPEADVARSRPVVHALRKAGPLGDDLRCLQRELDSKWNRGSAGLAAKGSRMRDTCADGGDTERPRRPRRSGESVSQALNLPARIADRRHAVDGARPHHHAELDRLTLIDGLREPVNRHAGAARRSRTGDHQRDK